MLNEHILEVLKDKKFLNEIANLTDVKDVKKVFKSKGIDLTDQDIEEMRKGASNYVNNIEVSEEFLDNIVGGKGGNNQQPIIINNYVNNVNSRPRTNSNSRPMTNAEGVLFGSIMTIAGAVIMGCSIKNGIKKGWLSNF